jgi:hypothetical protein
MRALATRLGVTPMALYRHVDGGDALENAVLTKIVASIPRLPRGSRWDGRYRAWALSARAALAPYPGAARRVLTQWTEIAPALAIVEQLLSVAIAARLPDPVAASNAVFAYVLMRDEAERAVRERGVVRRLAKLDEFPALRKHRHEYAVARVDEHFAFGLDALLAGIERGARRARA